MNSKNKSTSECQHELPLFPLLLLENQPASFCTSMHYVLAFFVFFCPTWVGDLVCGSLIRVFWKHSLRRVLYNTWLVNCARTTIAPLLNDIECNLSLMISDVSPFNCQPTYLNKSPPPPNLTRTQIVLTFMC